jgi:hypothetical protein
MSQTLKFRICGWGVLLGSVALLILTGVTNWFQGGHQGVTYAGKIINSVGSVSIDVMGLFFCGLAAGVCFGTRRWGWAFIFSLALVASAGWSANSVYSFQATEAISASKTRATANDRIADADKLARDSVGKMATFAGKAKTSAAREDFIYGSQEAIKSFRDAEVKVIVAPDAGAEVIAAKLGWNVETIQQLRSAYFAVLIIFLKMIGFPGAGFLLSWSPEPSDPAGRKVSGSPEGSGGKDKSQPETVAPRDGTVVDFPGKVAAPQQLQAESASNSDPPKVSAEPPRVSASAPRTVPLTLKPKQYASLEEFLTANPRGAKQSDIAKALNVSKAKVSRDVKRMQGRGKVKVDRKNGRTNSVTLAPRRNGASHAYPN